MTFLPIVERELRVSARRHSTFWMRLVVALAGIVVGLFLYLANLDKPPQKMGHEIFQGLAVLALLYGLVSGRLSTADCLSQEKREGTLGLLFLTDLKGYDVVLGKLVATSVNAFYGLVALFPVLAVTLLFGGITNGEFWRMVLVLVLTCLFSLAIGVFASVLSHTARQAMGLNFLLIILLMGVPPACSGVIAYFSPAHLVVPELFFPAPPMAFYFSQEASFRWHPGWFWGSVTVMSGLTLLLVWTASWLAPRSWQDVATASGKTPWRDRWLTWVYGPPRQRKALRTRLLAVNPFCWLASRSRFKPVWVWVFIAFVCGWWSYVHFYLHMEWNEEFFTLTTAVMLNSILKLWIAIEAGLRLAEDQKIGALELLLSTPLRASEIVAGQVLALRRQFLKPLVVVLVYEVVFTIAVSRHSYDSGPRAFAFGATNLILLLADIAAVTSVAMSSALTARSPNYASISTISRVLMLPWVVYGAIAVLVGMWSAMSSTPAPGWQFFLYLWFGLGLIADAAFGVPAWIQLRTRFRQLALRRFTNSAARPDA